MQEQEIINLAKTEIDKDPSINYVSLPETKTAIQELLGDKPVSVMCLRTYAKRYRTIYEYLIIKVYPDTWREQYQKIKLSQVRTL